MFYSFYGTLHGQNAAVKKQVAKQCALICAAEIIGDYGDCEEHTIDEPLMINRIKFWQQVRTAINNI